MIYTSIENLFIGYFLIALGLLVLLAIFGAIFGSGKTKRYRREITDMYVAGRIRQLAKKDNIDLEEEYKVFKQYNKRHRMENQSLDNTVEETLQDEIIEEADKKLNPKK